MARRDDHLAPSGRRDNRTWFQRDRDRVLYCSAFRRLAEVSQVATAAEGHLFHNRLTHSLKVAQIARRLAEDLARRSPKRTEEHGGIAPEVAETAALAHDLGHPPFGHVAEEALDDTIQRAGFAEGFEGNAQSFRIVTRLALRDSESPGLNLSRASLNAVLKYPWSRAVRTGRWKKFGAYQAERGSFDFARELGPQAGVASVEAQIMDWADDIAYAIHDIEDFARAGLIPIHALRGLTDEREKFLDWAHRRWSDEEHPSLRRWDAVKERFNREATLLPLTGPYEGSTADRKALRGWTARRIAECVTQTSLNQMSVHPGTFVVTRDELLRDEINLMKLLIWYYVIERPNLALQQVGQTKMVKKVFHAFWQAAHERPALLPIRFREELDSVDGEADATHLPPEYLVMRVVTDSIASMGEQELIQTHHRITGVELGSVLDPV